MIIIRPQQQQQQLQKLATAASATLCGLQAFNLQSHEQKNN